MLNKINMQTNYFRSNTSISMPFININIKHVFYVVN